MTTFDESWTGKIRRVGDLERPDHRYLKPEHICGFFGEFTPHMGFNYSTTNDFIFNIKKPVAKREKKDWKYKLRDINEVGKLIRKSLKCDTLSCYTFVPAPPSMPPDHPEYDDRTLQIIKAIDNNVNVCALLETAVSRRPAHDSNDRPTPDDIESGVRICDEQSRLRSDIQQIILLDDVLYHGATFVGCRRKLLDYFPNAKVYGLFVARCVPERSIQEYPQEF